MREIRLDCDGLTQVACVMNNNRLYIRYDDFYDMLVIGDVCSVEIDSILSESECNFNKDSMVYHNNKLWIDLSCLINYLCLYGDSITQILIDSIFKGLNDVIGNLTKVINICLPQ